MQIQSYLVGESVVDIAVFRINSGRARGKLWGARRDEVIMREKRGRE